MTVYTDTNGTAWYVNLVDVAELDPIAAHVVGRWLNTDLDPWERNGAVDALYYPLRGDETEQLTARKELLRDGPIGGGGVRVYGRAAGLHVPLDAAGEGDA